MNIPVFVSCATSLSPEQNVSRELVLQELDRFGLEPRAVGRSDYPTDLPLREVYTLAKRCSGGVILGFGQFEAPEGVWKPGTPEARPTKSPVLIPSAWNHLEAGLLFSLKVPLLVFKQEGISGGVFDNGVTDVFVHRMPQPSLDPAGQRALSAVFLKWQADVRTHYYGR